MSWQSAVEEYGRLLDEALRSHFTSPRREAEAYHPYIGHLYENLEEYVRRRGMRLASFTAYLTYKGYGGQVDGRMEALCVGLELYRHCILVHDDLIDRDETRRGGEAFHKLASKPLDRRFGEAAAVFMGNTLFALAQDAVLNSGFEASKAAVIADLIADRYRQVNESQVLDLLFEYREPTVEEWRTMASRRAASLFTLALKTGGVLADAPPADLALLEEAGINTGYSFDIQDDIIDTFATPEQYGRAPGGDLVKGKRPLHIILALQRATEAERAFISDLRGVNALRPEDLEKARSIIRRTGALDTAKSILMEHGARARTLLSETGLSAESRQLVSALIRYVEESLDWYR